MTKNRKSEIRYKSKDNSTFSVKDSLFNYCKRRSEDVRPIKENYNAFQEILYSSTALFEKKYNAKAYSFNFSFSL